MTADQRSASDPGASVWVGASAGTGKTKVLTDRVLRLMLARTPPERILCLTFTKAAAAEMSNRLARRLARWAVMDDETLAREIAELESVPPEPEAVAFARCLFARVLDVPGGLRIQTIHSFCQTLLGRFPLEAGVAPAFELVDERGQSELLAEAEAEVLERARRGDDPDITDALALVSGIVSQDVFGEVVGALAKARGRFARALDEAGGAEPLIERIYAHLGFDHPADEEALIRDACDEAAFDRKALQAAVEALAASNGTDQKRARDIADWLSAPDRATAWNAYGSAWFTAKGELLKKLCAVEVSRGRPEIADALLREAERVKAARTACALARVGAATAALVRLGAAQIAAYEAAKRRRALLDYEDLILIAGRLLADPGVAPWVLYKLDGGIDHILIDEAQDTNPDQWRVVERIAAEFFAGEGARDTVRTLFAVGDAKQSIFSFQGADRQVFIESETRFGERARAAQALFRQVGLTTSFRSTRAVLDVVDRVFARPEALDGVADAPLQHLAHRMGQAGEVELWPPEQPRADDDVPDWSLPIDQELGDSAPARLAQRIARTVHDWIATGAVLPSRGRAIRPGDVMVLVRRRNAFVEALVKNLKSLGVPVAGADRMILTEQLAVMDLVALGRFLLLPEDDHMLAVVLKGPLVGFDDDQLYDLAHARDGSLWRALRERAEERADFRAAHAFLADALARADFLRPFEFYARVLGPLGGRGRILGRLGRDAADPLDEFLAQALAYERRGAPSLEGFLHWLEAGAAEIKRDLEQGRDEVRILTVHGSKGLEAPIVFLPDTCQVPRGQDELLWSADGLPFWPVRAANKVGPLADLEEARKLSQAREHRRLLYVALTRAEDRLVICGWQNPKHKPPEECWYELSRFAFEAAESRREADGREILRIDCPQTALPAERGHVAVTAAEALPAPEWIARAAPAEPRPTRPLSPSRPAGEEPAPVSPLGGDGGRRFARGKLIHRLLQTLPELAAEARGEAARRWLAQPGHGLDAASVEAIAAETLAVLDAPDFAALFGPGSRAEVPIAGRLGDEVVLGQVDRLVVAPDSVLIADYKTNRPPPTDPADVAPVYLRQMALYRAVLGRVYPDRPVRCAIVWTDGPRLMALDGALLDAQLGLVEA
jgi:ATP-dependent helicase/nuclease subunit A